MKLADIKIETENTVIKSILEFHIGGTENVDEELQIDIIEKALEDNKNIELLTEEEYNEARAVFCDIALNYFKQ